jgi:hypothetical protein
VLLSGCRLGRSVTILHHSEATAVVRCMSPGVSVVIMTVGTHVNEQKKCELQLSKLCDIYFIINYISPCPCVTDMFLYKCKV